MRKLRYMPIIYLRVLPKFKHGITMLVLPLERPMATELILATENFITMLESMVERVLFSMIDTSTVLNRSKINFLCVKNNTDFSIKTLLTTLQI